VPVVEEIIEPASSPEPEAVLQPLPALPGAILRAAREARGMSVADVAHSLKFSIRQIEALETDDFANLPAPTFVRGFVRGYAKLLRLEPEPLLAMIESTAPSNLPDVRPPQNMGEAAQPTMIHRKSSRPVLLGAGILFACATVLGIWHFLGLPAPPLFSLGKSEMSRQATPAADAQIRPPTVTPLSGSNGEAVAPGMSSALPVDARQLVFVFHEKSWLEVKDASNQAIVTGVFDAGERQVATGKAPFRLWIGKASGVRVFEGDIEIDLKPHARDEVARLTVE
jgi:cytoskeleton protein RodZ